MDRKIISVNKNNKHESTLNTYAQIWNINAKLSDLHTQSNVPSLYFSVFFCSQAFSAHIFIFSMLMLFLEHKGAATIRTGLVKSHIRVYDTHHSQEFSSNWQTDRTKEVTSWLTWKRFPDMRAELRKLTKLCTLIRDLTTGQVFIPSFSLKHVNLLHCRGHVQTCCCCH